MNKIYESPKMTIELFDIENIITGSNNNFTTQGADGYNTQKVDWAALKGTAANTIGYIF